MGLEFEKDAVSAPGQDAHYCHAATNADENRDEHTIACETCCTQCTSFILQGEEVLATFVPAEMALRIDPSDVIPVHEAPPLRPPRV